MMRRVDLLPEAYVIKRRERRNIGMVAVAGGVVLVLLAAYWFYLGTQVSGARDDLAAVQAKNAILQTQIAELQKFADLEAEVSAKQTALATVMAGDIDWPAILTEVAMVVPGEVWLQSLSASAGLTEGAAPVGTETAPIRISDQPVAFGRVQFSGSSLSMPGVAKWLIRLASVKDFEAIWLNSANASATSTGGVGQVDFSSTIELNANSASNRFLTPQGEAP
jgi:Tfp pilus assembly protein PilN